MTFRDYIKRLEPLELYCGIRSLGEKLVEEDRARDPLDPTLQTYRLLLMESRRRFPGPRYYPNPKRKKTLAEYYNQARYYRP